MRSGTASRAVSTSTGSVDAARGAPRRARPCRPCSGRPEVEHRCRVGLGAQFALARPRRRAPSRPGNRAGAGRPAGRRRAAGRLRRAGCASAAIVSRRRGASVARRWSCVAGGGADVGRRRPAGACHCIHQKPSTATSISTATLRQALRTPSSRRGRLAPAHHRADQVLVVQPAAQHARRRRARRRWPASGWRRPRAAPRATRRRARCRSPSPRR